MLAGHPKHGSMQGFATLALVPSRTRLCKTAVLRSVFSTTYIWPVIGPIPVRLLVKVAHKSNIVTPLLRTKQPLSLHKIRTRGRTMSNPKTPMTDLLRKLKADTDTRIKNDQALVATLDDLIARVGEVEGLEIRAATARVQLASDTSQLRETQAALDEAKGEYSALQAQLSVPSTKLHELRVMLRDM
jgi:hypothetical protein